ncbi:probable inactive poly [ADP-ribose] polymerase SRO2 [Salvia hispanica]|uniref:probable inactive poly [ADP-ribose] polymerase SRO2 n=1 Tax=Salvia hispanica TaxID=49212 RepID=UPI0020094EBF|nr:probable inactive poly [ADP-ribose] polymerase SRO2 [Salvia hispanica]
MEREPQISMTVEDYDAAMDSDCESSVVPQFGDFARVEVDQPKYGVVEKMFRAGLGVLGEGVNVVALHMNSSSSIARHARLEAFRLYARAVAVKRGGDANIRYAWYGGARDEILGIVTHGFGRCSDFEDRVSNGIGIYLSPANFPIDCAMRAKEDEFGVKHLLLCRVILGNTEKIATGSRQFQPSSADFDSGVDNPFSPLQYTIWSAYMNSHIFPLFIISFTAPSLSVSGTSKFPNSPRVEFSVLMNVLSRFLSPSQMTLILKCYNDFQEKKIGRPHLITRWRSLVGDKLLLLAIRMCGFRPT